MSREMFSPDLFDSFSFSIMQGIKYIYFPAMLKLVPKLASESSTGISWDLSEYWIKTKDLKSDQNQPLFLLGAMVCMVKNATGFCHHAEALQDSKDSGTR